MSLIASVASRRLAATVTAAAIAGSLVMPSPRVGAATTVTLVRVIDSSTWSPPSPDTSGIAIRPSNGRFVVVDSEVDETTLWSHANVWSVVGGAPKGSWSTERFSREPSGIAIQGKDTFWISDDSLDHLIRWRPGPDGRWGTVDDVPLTIPAPSYGSRDPEDLAWGGGSLFVADGDSTDIVRIERGPNGRFDFDAPPGDDVVTRFDTSALGITEPEGVTYDPTTNGLDIVSRREDVIIRTTLDGVLLESIDVSAFHVDHASGIAVVPPADASSPTMVYVTDRGVDNDVNPAENDGRIHEFALSATPAPL
jgi:hypothetical protein